MEKTTISLCMIVKDEERHIGRCLNSVGNFFDEIIIVDTGSKDKTVSVCKKFTDKIFNFQWVDDFSKARNFSFSKATCDYIMWLDADDVIEKESLKKLFLWKQQQKTADCYYMPYHLTDSDGNTIVLVYMRERILKRSFGAQWKEPVHEYLDTKNAIIANLDCAVTHKKIGTSSGSRNLDIYRKNIRNGVELTPRGTYYYARELFYNKCYRESITMIDAYLSMEGWIEDKLAACIIAYNCYSSLNMIDKGIEYILKSFTLDEPRGEAVCILGEYFFNKNNYKIALYWYNLAINLNPNNHKGFKNLNFYNYIPLIQSAVCYYRLGNNTLFKEFNERAAKFNSDSKSVENNRNYYK